MERDIHHIDYEDYHCCFCNVLVTTQWARGKNGEQLGMLSVPGHCLIGDCVAHDECLNKSLEDYNRGNH